MNSIHLYTVELFHGSVNPPPPQALQSRHTQYILLKYMLWYFHVGLLYALSSASSRWLTHVCSMFPVHPPHMIYTNDTLLDEVSECRHSLWFSFFLLFFFFTWVQHSSEGGTLCELWVSLTQPTRKGLVAEVRTLNLAAVFVFTPQASLAFFSFATHDNVGKTAPSWSAVTKWLQHLTTWSKPPSKRIHHVFCFFFINWYINSQLVTAVSCMEGNVGKLLVIIVKKYYLATRFRYFRMEEQILVDCVGEKKEDFFWPSHHDDLVWKTGIGTGLFVDWLQSTMELHVNFSDDDRCGWL